MIDTERTSALLRKRSIDLPARRVLVARIAGSAQEQDLTEPVNCEGFGRIRHFKLRSGSASWPINPLPIVPAKRALGLEGVEEIRAQVFQNAACNWRCWYCYVPFDLLAARGDKGTLLSAGELLDLYEKEASGACVLDLSGGQPDLVPEWAVWIVEEVIRRGLDKVYIWSDDNLSTDYLWRYLSEDQIHLLAAYPRYGRVCCFKGFDEASFAFNTNAAPGLFAHQFELAERLVKAGFDLYGYVTLTFEHASIDLKAAMKIFFDSLQAIHELFPLRVIPLEIRMYSPVATRMSLARANAMDNQYRAITIWQQEIQDRFTAEQLATQICELRIK